MTVRLQACFKELLDQIIKRDYAEATPANWRIEEVSNQSTACAQALRNREVRLRFTHTLEAQWS